MAECEVIAHVYRGNGIESRHYGAAAVVDASGKLIASIGDPDFVTFSRSALKPIQALPTVARGVKEKYNLSWRHLAIMCGSHNGEERHKKAAGEILGAIGCTESDLNCGVHQPYIYRMTGEAPAPGMRFSQLYNNCSGKHSGMLALCRLMEVPIVNYREYDHPIQEEIRSVVCTLSGLSEGDLIHGIDGCSIPNYAFPLRALAGLYAKLAGGRGSDDRTSSAMEDVVRAMRTEPAMVSGIGRFDLALAEAAGDRLVCKVGGEAIECVALTDRGWGVALKVADGGARALGVAVTALLRNLDVLTDQEVKALQPHARPYLKNHRKIVVGHIEPAIRVKTT